MGMADEVVESLDQRIALVMEGIDYYTLLILRGQRDVEIGIRSDLAHVKMALAVDRQKFAELRSELERLQMERSNALKLPSRGDSVAKL